MGLGDMTISEAYPHLKNVALAYGLKLNKFEIYKIFIDYNYTIHKLKNLFIYYFNILK